MLNQGTVSATIAVKDIAAGKQFYGGTLGLEQIDENPSGVMYKSGIGQLFVYQSVTAGTSQATSASWRVSDIEVAMADLAAKGVVFEHYDIPNATLEGDIYVMGPMKSAWFKDPDGNILNLTSM